MKARTIFTKPYILYGSPPCSRRKKGRSPVGPRPEITFLATRPFKAAPEGIHEPKLRVAVDAPHGLICVPVVRQAQKRPAAFRDSTRRFSAPRAVLTLSVAAPLALWAVITCATEALDSFLCRGSNKIRLSPKPPRTSPQMDLAFLGGIAFPVGYLGYLYKKGCLSLWGCPEISTSEPRGWLLRGSERPGT